MPRYDENDMAAAIADVAQGVPVLRAAKKWHVPRSTLRGRLTGTTPRFITNTSFQKLSVSQETALETWVLGQEALGYPPTHSEIRHIAEKVLLASGQPPTLGIKWVQKFLRRYPSLKVHRPRKIDSARIHGATTEVIRKWWPRLQNPTTSAIKPENRWNMDETGIMAGQGSNGLVIGSNFTRSIQRKQPGLREWTSFIECISATGKSLPPLCIFRGKTVQQQWFPSNELQRFEGWKFTATPNGWTDDNTAVEWLKSVFLPMSTPEVAGDPRLLILDGHHSHATPEFMTECFKNNVFIVYLPPHSSHVLQPLDLSVFSVLKSEYRRRLTATGFVTDSTVVGKRLLLQCYYEARGRAFKATIIRSGFKTTGLWPLRIAKPLMNPLLLENANSQRHKAVGPQIVAALESGAIVPEPETPKKSSRTTWETPVRSYELARQLSTIRSQSRVSPTRRSYHLKLIRAWEQKEFDSVRKDCQIAILEAKLEAARPVRRRKVQMDPNEAFVDIRDVELTNLINQEMPLTSEELPEEEDSNDVLDCIEVVHID
ncbi:uncharacterized protein PpBr36_11424 [Pyricularia pennisetigena]|uniref:uncharacterized protein n=1 Tax=Pyricularia pennisetigena TaxID=1578925 RepID=UPI001151ECA1|nr:uncharacterized protein PpBr36_11424 [Pyricularia pennisetigena]TLS20308.1 hypothetical protein PpBr36_11424 [Pyricularia pennisetigena]